jgi:serine phosphatase RsbU (regulator of sigma subunit)
MEGQAMTLIEGARPEAALAEDELRTDPAFLHEMLERDTQDIDRVASTFQALLPADAQLAGYDIVGRSISLDAAGGDVLDWNASEERVTFSVADVMGRGLPAAMLAAGLRGALRARAEQMPELAVAALEAQLAPEMRRAESFATLFHGRLTPRNGRIDFVDAGHGISIVLRANGTTEILRSRELPIGFQKPGCVRQGESVALRRGDALIVGSDGLLELHDGTLATLELVAEWYREAGDLDTFLETLAASARGARPGDDVTVLAIVRH